MTVMLGSIQKVVRSNLCISCGGCCVVSPQGNVKMQEHTNLGMLYPALSPSACGWGNGIEYEICPGKGYEILQMGQDYFPNAPFHDIDLGRWFNVWAGHSLSDKITANASSGGLMTAIAEHLLIDGIVDGVVVTRIRYGFPGPRAETFIATSLEELISAQGSKYCPVPVLEIIPEIESFHGRVLFIGTPCQIAGLRMLQRISPSLREKIPLTMGNFCGGFRDLRETDTLIKRAGIHPSDVVRFRYRGGGQPGSMIIENSEYRRSELPYPGYARMTGYVKHKRCRLCVDATAELADFSCGDAWIPRFLNSGQAWSLVITRSESAEILLKKMVIQKKITLAEVTIDELKKSQYDNLNSKKVRQYARRKLYKMLTIQIPKYDGGFQVITGGVLYELRVLITHTIFYILEKFHIYPIIAKAIKRYPKDL